MVQMSVDSLYNKDITLKDLARGLFLILSRYKNKFMVYSINIFGDCLCLKSTVIIVKPILF